MYRIFDHHTADIGLEVSGNTLEELFTEAALGWKHLVLEDSPTAPKEKKTVQLTASDLNDLLVQWLSELNYLLNAHFWVLDSIEQINIQKTNGTYTLNATITGEPLDSDRHYIYFEIKAVTYHQLNIEKKGGKFRTRIIFDI